MNRKNHRAKDVYLVIGADGTPCVYTFKTESRAAQFRDEMNTTKITKRFAIGWMEAVNNRPFRVEKYNVKTRYKKKRRAIRAIITPRLVEGE
jgi:hypothetical protein